MAETIIAIGASIGTAATTASTAVSGLFAGAGTGAAAGAASGAAAGASTGFSLGGAFSTISTALSIGSALSSISQGYAESAARKDQANQLETQNQQQRAQDSQKRATLAQEYADIVSEQSAVQMASGLNPGVGTPASVRRATTDFAEMNLSTSRENTRNRTAVARMQQRSLNRSANNAVIAGFSQAGSTVAGAFQQVG